MKTSHAHHGRIHESNHKEVFVYFYHLVIFFSYVIKWKKHGIGFVNVVQPMEVQSIIVTRVSGGLPPSQYLHTLHVHCSFVLSPPSFLLYLSLFTFFFLLLFSLLLSFEFSNISWTIPTIRPHSPTRLSSPIRISSSTSISLSTSISSPTRLSSSTRLCPWPTYTGTKPSTQLWVDCELLVTRKYLYIVVLS